MDSKEGERYVIDISADHESVRLTDRETEEVRTFVGSHALWDVLGILAEWRERDRGHAGDHAPPCGFPDVIPCICPTETSEN